MMPAAIIPTVRSASLSVAAISETYRRVINALACRQSVRPLQLLLGSADLHTANVLRSHRDRAALNPVLEDRECGRTVPSVAFLMRPRRDHTMRLEAIINSGSKNILVQFSARNFSV